METEKSIEQQLNEQREHNKRYANAILGLAFAYENIKKEDMLLNAFILSIMSSLSEKLDLEDKKINNEELNDLLLKINNNDFDLNNLIQEMKPYLEEIELK